MTHQIFPVPVYPIGEFLDGSRLCASIEKGRAVDWFPAHRDFDLDDIEVPIALDSSDFLSEEHIDDAAPTLKDREVLALLGYHQMDLDWEN